MSGASFAWSVSGMEDQWFDGGADGVPVRTITKITRLIDVSPCVWAAYPQTSLSVTRDETPTNLQRLQLARNEADLGLQREMIANLRNAPNVELDLTPRPRAAVPSLTHARARWGEPCDAPEWYTAARRTSERFGCGHVERV
ncbi:MAG: HK97 family phage prohead protease [Actinomycetota bacterium]